MNPRTSRVGLEFLDVLVDDGPEVVHVELVVRHNGRGLVPTNQHVVHSVENAMRSQFGQIFFSGFVFYTALPDSGYRANMYHHTVYIVDMLLTHT